MGTALLSLMAVPLPPPDPNESFGFPSDEEWPLPGPAAVFLAGPPSAEANRISDALLKLRPGALIIVASG